MSTDVGTKTPHEQQRSDPVLFQQPDRQRYGNNAAGDLEQRDREDSAKCIVDSSIRQVAPDGDGDEAHGERRQRLQFLGRFKPLKEILAHMAQNHPDNEVACRPGHMGW